MTSDIRDLFSIEELIAMQQVTELPTGGLASLITFTDKTAFAGQPTYPKWTAMVNGKSVSFTVPELMKKLKNLKFGGSNG